MRRKTAWLTGSNFCSLIFFHREKEKSDTDKRDVRYDSFQSALHTDGCDRNDCRKRSVNMSPMSALDGGADGLDLLSQDRERGFRQSENEGILMLEIGSAQAEAVTELLEAEGVYEGIEVHQDLAGLDRIVVFCPDNGDQKYAVVLGI